MTTLDKETYIKLAEAYCKQSEYENKLRECVNDITKKYATSLSFIGLPFNSDLIMWAVSDLLGVNFSYFLYGCNGDFEKFNNNITLSDGSHPNVQDFGNMWEFENGAEEAEMGKAKQRSSS